MPKPRAPREAPPPTKWGRSKGGTAFEVFFTRKRNQNGKKIYRLIYCQSGVKGSQEWTLDELNAHGIRWLKNKPK